MPPAASAHRDRQPHQRHEFQHRRNEADGEHHLKRALADAGEVLPEGQREMFIVRLRTLLSKSAPNSFTWIMNRGTYYRLRQKELDLGPAPDRIQPEYALTAKFLSLTDESSQRRTAAYLCVYELTNIKTGALLWTDKYEVKKTAVKGMLD